MFQVKYAGERCGTVAIGLPACLRRLSRCWCMCSAASASRSRGTTMVEVYSSENVNIQSRPAPGPIHLDSYQGSTLAQTNARHATTSLIAKYKELHHDSHKHETILLVCLPSHKMLAALSVPSLGLAATQADHY